MFEVSNLFIITYGKYSSYIRIINNLHYKLSATYRRAIGDRFMTFLILFHNKVHYSLIL
jgi:hypothetical protein